MSSEISIEALLTRRKKGHSLEAPFYTSEEIFKLDMEIIFGRHWLHVGVEPDVAEPGDVMVVDIGKTSVIVMRDDDMELRAYHNVCRHRGARIILQEKTSVGNLVCSYHQWTYGQDGELLFAEHMGSDFDRKCRNLKKVHIRSVGGLIFICLAEEAPEDIDRMAAAIEPYILPHDLKNCKVAKTVDLIEKGNWKLTMENNRECYHCVSNHPELTIPLFEYGFGFAPDGTNPKRMEHAAKYDALVQSCHTSWEAAGFPSREVERLTDTTGFRAERLPLDGAGEAHTKDTRSASKKLLGSITERKLGALSFWTQPNSWNHFMSDHIVTFSVFPLGPDRNLLRTRWLVHKDAVEGVDYDLNRLTEVWEATNQQDADLVEISHNGALSPAYEPGPYSPYTEPLVEKFTEWYVGRMAEHLLGKQAPVGVAAE
ncbi:aromatic ring-hydroxylating dioxygenase subunit alpha (plasmid) [Azospirillum oryzae]|uniref:Aromatic ring-hydroxylating dioxygenase subunit alpha n=1 Tax=Azospirillum oryzae TaxID=286727 RepID=A0A6N1AGI5_9PROT|nr:aromatic ring-hydroxylating dioxygenase subunit alpha [Azospirillum oryzae]KAA0587321.1 aromatic ring-hydroxylating dioxygenase subunit alpha [Azospirillum oryzae]QKS50620.1 aromatic ring-hydroxylating dioxygenase subunit alpha [Azospirillum oryzae]GLR79198.1 (Fe-S)-binding protein [Azospirillum oryzae]